MPDPPKLNVPLSSEELSLFNGGGLELKVDWYGRCVVTDPQGKRGKGRSPKQALEALYPPKEPA